MQLNNLLQANGGAGRLRWGDPIRGGPDHCPSWTINASRQSRSRLPYSHLTSAYSRWRRFRLRHREDLGCGKGGSRSQSPETSPCLQHYLLVAREGLIVHLRVSSFSASFCRLR